MGGSQETEAREESAASTEEKNDGVIPLERTLDERCASEQYREICTCYICW